MHSGCIWLAFYCCHAGLAQPDSAALGLFLLWLILALFLAAISVAAQLSHITAVCLLAMFRLGHNTSHFNVGNYRRLQKEGHEMQDASFFDSQNKVCLQLADMQLEVVL
eukprot:GHRR01022827.1.p1 GENE.GHRR01022827.1~~GHRR01022827.1.p1  ORF type:complete len:109 (-),score=30.04 GHRR01022827.1:565-891(-)